MTITLLMLSEFLRSFFLITNPRCIKAFSTFFPLVSSRLLAIAIEHTKHSTQFCSESWCSQCHLLNHSCWHFLSPVCWNLKLFGGWKAASGIFGRDAASDCCGWSSFVIEGELDEVISAAGWFIETGDGVAAEAVVVDVVACRKKFDISDVTSVLLTVSTFWCLLPESTDINWQSCRFMITSVLWSAKKKNSNAIKVYFKTVNKVDFKTVNKMLNYSSLNFYASHFSF